MNSLRRILAVSRFYSAYMEEYPNSSGWSSVESAESLHSFAAQHISNPTNTQTSVLDVGCGPGTFLTHLRNRVNFRGRYEGIDLFYPFYDEAKRRFEGDERAKFHYGDVLALDLHETYDYAFCLGLFGIRQELESKFELDVIRLLSRHSGNILISLNDSRHFPKARIAEQPDLLLHHPKEFADCLSENIPNISVSMAARTMNGSRKTLLHVSTELNTT